MGTCGHDQKVAVLRELGRDRPTNYREEYVAAVLGEEYADGVALIYESVGGELFDVCVDHLAL